MVTWPFVFMNFVKSKISWYPFLSKLPSPHSPPHPRPNGISFRTPHLAWLHVSAPVAEPLFSRSLSWSPCTDCTESLLFPGNAVFFHTFVFSLTWETFSSIIYLMTSYSLSQSSSDTSDPAGRGGGGGRRRGSGQLGGLEQIWVTPLIARGQNHLPITQ